MASSLAKLTLNAPPDVIEQARKLSKITGQSISSMFILFIKQYSKNQFATPETSPFPADSCAVQAVEIGLQGQAVSPEWNYKDELAEDLCKNVTSHT